MILGVCRERVIWFLLLSFAFNINLKVNPDGGQPLIFPSSDNFKKYLSPQLNEIITTPRDFSRQNELCLKCFCEPNWHIEFKKETLWQKFEDGRLRK